ncbi:MAG: T9SS type A sorting domain-containing protein [Bacteroidetes bacterium]|nr:T9SS type A sorting domain-containing protein [Bacteroidota bacterium]MCH8524648.1 T9SS type A sorting domain-containing protein [Balneolales bacterium]
MRKLLLTLCAIFIPVLVFAQWENQGPFPNAEYETDTHGLAVDPDGKIWNASFYQVGRIPLAGNPDSLVVALRVDIFLPDGTPADFSPISVLNIGGEPDTLRGSVRGMRADHNGNILLALARTMYRIDYKTGEGMNKMTFDANALTTPGVDDNGNIYVGFVIPTATIDIYDENFNFIETAVDSARGFSRTLEVSPDGNTIWWPGYTTGSILAYSRPDEFSRFNQVPDTLVKGFASESMIFDRINNLLYASAGSGNDAPNFFNGESTGTDFVPNRYYGIDIVTGEIRDNGFDFLTEDPVNHRPRGVAFSPDGLTVYHGAFRGGGTPISVQFATRESTTVSVENHIDLAVGYTLNQNFPNPFNPTTTISFELAQSGMTTLRVYDALGRVVATLVNDTMPAGFHNVNFDASNLGSGVYIYELVSGNVRLTNKMTLVK